ncbi:MAG: tetratricopeptide repeat protein [Acidobacteria bacterium]|nr:tetratricopeptide repeat protein [Acidobacteriota bacterium]
MICFPRLSAVLAALVCAGLLGCASSPSTRNKGEARQAEGLYRLAQLDFSQGKNQDAITHAKKSIDLDPKNAHVHAFLGLVYLYLSDYRSAEKSLQEAVRLNPYLTDARNTLGAVYMKTGRNQEAQNEFLECLKDTTYSHPEKVLYNLGTLQLEEKHISEAEASFRRAVQANASYAKGYYGLGQALLLSGRRDEALKNFEKVIALDPSSPEAAKAKEALGQTRGAAKG